MCVRALSGRTHGGTTLSRVLDYGQLLVLDDSLTAPLVSS